MVGKQVAFLRDDEHAAGFSDGTAGRGKRGIESISSPPRGIGGPISHPVKKESTQALRKKGPTGVFQGGLGVSPAYTRSAVGPNDLFMGDVAFERPLFTGLDPDHALPEMVSCRSVGSLSRGWRSAGDTICKVVGGTISMDDSGDAHCREPSPMVSLPGSICKFGRGRHIRGSLCSRQGSGQRRE